MPVESNKLVYAVTFSPDATSLAAAAGDGAVRVWDVATASQGAGLAHGAAPNSVVYSADGRFIGTISRDNYARLWDAHTGQELLRVRHDAPFSQMAISPDSTRFARSFRVRWYSECGQPGRLEFDAIL